MLRKKRSFKLLLCAALITMSTSVFAACGSGGSGDSGSGSGTSGSSVSGSSASGSKTAGSGAKATTDKDTLVWDITADCKTLDPTLISATNGSTVSRALFEGLTRFDETGKKIIPGVAEDLPKVSDDGLVYTFKIRDDAKWSDGKPVTANDFVYSYIRGLNKETAAEYASELYRLKNGEAFNDGTAKPEDVGVKAIDDKTLEITLEYPVAYFDELLVNAIWMPTREDIISKQEGAISSDLWARKADTFVSNGPYKFSEWVEKDHITVVKNENWHGASDVKIEKIEFTMIEDRSTRLAAFEGGELDYMEEPPATEIARLKSEGTLEIFPYIGIYYYDINMVADKLAAESPEAAEALKDVKVRKALALAINRQSIVDIVTLGEQKPALSFVPYGVQDDKGNEFTDKEYFKDNDVETAKKLLAEAGYPDGKNFPKLTFTYNTDDNHRNVAQAIQDMWKNNLGIEMELEVEEWKVFQQTRVDKEYVLARDGWIGDYMDANTFLELLISKNVNNNSGYNNPEYDAKIDAAAKELDKAKRITLLKEAEAILMEDMPVIPIYYYTLPVCRQPYVKNVVKNPTGACYFEYMSLEGK